MAVADEQQFCLRWNNFQANITSQFEALRDDEDFTDVTIACEGQRLQAHKVVLSACSPFFKDLFKTNPCSHPIIFMRDVDARDIAALLEFMYAGEVNVAQAHLSAFLKTAESLKIRGLTDTTATQQTLQEDGNGRELSASAVQQMVEVDRVAAVPSSSTTDFTSTVTSSQDVARRADVIPNTTSKRQCNKSETPTVKKSRQIADESNDFGNQLKLELPDFVSDDDALRDDNLAGFYPLGDLADLQGGMEIIPQSIPFNANEIMGLPDPPSSCTAGGDVRKLHSLDPRPCEECGRVYSNLSNLRQHMKLIHYPTYVQCPLCNKPFKTDLYLRRHLSSAHDAPKTPQSKHFKHTNNNVKYELRTPS